MHLHEFIAANVGAWRKAGYPAPGFEAVAEMLEFQRWDTPDGTGSRSFRFLRPPQMEALETYWYIRVVCGTPRMLDLYKTVFHLKKDRLEALGIFRDAIKDFLIENDEDELYAKILADPEFVAEHDLEALRETIALDYPSYILALAMGAGKTALIGAIIATEFAMALEYPDGPFMQNALVFAPGLTILGALRELATLPYDAILPPRFHKFFAATVKLIFTRDGEPDIPVIRGDTFNVIVTNTEKIRITKETIRKGDLKALFNPAQEDEAKSEVANRRLQTIASLPHLGVFSDEAHHTFGRNMADDLKRVRQTIDYLHRTSPNLVAVVNTTGTPYLNRQPLCDVVFWYGLSAGIRDGILKAVTDRIHSYEFDDQSVDDFVTTILADFFTKYRDVRLPNGSAAKIALYFPQVEDLLELRPAVEAWLQKNNLGADLVLANHSKSPEADVKAFDRLNDPAAQHRVILLVNKGTEGWNCPSLFACALARKLKTSNNFVLQAASRCLRQIPGNPHAASIYLSRENEKTLERELEETYGETVRDLERAATASRRERITLRKIKLPPLVVRQIVRRVERIEQDGGALSLTRPAGAGGGTLRRQSFDLSDAGRTPLAASGSEEIIETAAKTIDPYTAATKLAAVYRVDFWTIKNQLASLYPDGNVPQAHLDDLARQIERQTSAYRIVEEPIEIALALVKPEGFDKATGEDGVDVYTAEISYPVGKEHLLKRWEDFQNKNPGGYSFHYTPYNFDSQPEAEFFEDVLRDLNQSPSEVEDLYFTGALTGAGKTDFRIEYRDVDGRWRDYTPDFIIRLKSGRCLIVEIKAKRHETETTLDLARDDKGEPTATTEGSKAAALRKWTNLNPDRLKYQIHYVDNAIGRDQTRETSEVYRA